MTAYFLSHKLPTYFSPDLHFYTTYPPPPPKKSHKIFGFLTFSGGIEMKD